MPVYNSSIPLFRLDLQPNIQILSEEIEDDLNDRNVKYGIPIKERVYRAENQILIQPIELVNFVIGKREKPNQEQLIDFDNDDINEEVDLIQKKAKLIEEENAV